ncbi:MAG: DUF3789 domain-containing protein [Ruminococcus sp.]|nr:DUF3789 domain-containing protein [Ruminococcus sp.]
MTQFIIFMVGSMFGSFVGVAVMCLLQINHKADNDNTKKDDHNA